MVTSEITSPDSRAISPTCMNLRSPGSSPSSQAPVTFGIGNYLLLVALID